ncbi:MAG TPA: S53 family peptidase [Jatrophihabitans sp.]|nr:S53 family peptidase [Jatrophihabitans sp.]
MLALLAALAATTTAVIAAPAGAGAAPRLLSGLLPFGCARPGAAQVTCFGAVLRGVGFLAPDITPGPVGYGPTQIRGAYKLRGTLAHGRTVAIVDAYNDPNAESDLAVYRKARGLPSCTTDNGCFRKVNQNGGKASLPQGDYGWAEEISLDLDAVSATCPSCHILLVEANAPNTKPLMTAIDTAVRLGADAVSASWGGPEDSSILRADSHLNHPGVPIAAAAGDSGYGPQWPASSRFVTAVGGTTLRHATTSRGWSEQVWVGTGSGCSRFERKPSWQHDDGCNRRTIADVAAVANPATGLGVYDTYNNCSPVLPLSCDTQIASGLAQGMNGWAQIGGTSLSAPIIASVYALAGKHHKARWAYQHRGALFDVRSGSNGTCQPAYLCTARKGYDGPTGLGTPHRLGAF